VSRCSPASRSARACGEQAAVGGQRDVVQAVERGEPGDQLGQALAQQRFSAGDPQLAHADAHETAHETLDLVEGQSRGRVEAMIVRDAIGRHAVGTAEIAGLDHRQAQVAQGTAQRVAREAVGLRIGVRHGVHGSGGGRRCR